MCMLKKTRSLKRETRLVRFNRELGLWNARTRGLGLGRFSGELGLDESLGLYATKDENVLSSSSRSAPIYISFVIAQYLDVVDWFGDLKRSDPSFLCVGDPNLGGSRER